MVKNNRGSTESTMLPGVILGTVLEIVIIVGLGMLLAWMMLQSYLTEASLGLAAGLITLTAAFTGTFIAGIRAKGQYAIVCGITAALMLFVLLATNILFFDGELERVWWTALSTLVGALLGCVLSMHIKGSNGKRRKKRSG